MSVHIAIKSTDVFFAELEKDWMAIDRGDTVPGPVHRVYFASAEALSKVLTKQRHQLLRTLHTHDGLSIRALASVLQRDYKNVYQDVKILEDSGLIERDGKNHITAPYEKLTIELPLAA
ncbi:MAG: MarR family transcriptional regulator [Deltaproteobacteria bacterium]|jgi:predicted transcriptional regulator|nr:MarR family transcriptional regulator [Deltaproteobacteria bacterium]